MTMPRILGSFSSLNGDQLIAYLVDYVCVRSCIEVIVQRE